MENLHTSGNWKAVKHKVQGEKKSTYLIMQDCGVHSKTIAMLVQPLGMSDEEFAANAGLIAMAPTMFNFLNLNHAAPIKRNEKLEETEK